MILDIAPISIMIRSEVLIDVHRLKMMINGDRFLFESIQHGTHYHLDSDRELQWWELYSSVILCHGQNELSFLCPIFHESTEIQDIIIDSISISNAIYDRSSFYNHDQDTYQTRPDLGSNHWKPGTKLDNSGQFYLNFSWPLSPQQIL